MKDGTNRIDVPILEYTKDGWSAIDIYRRPRRPIMSELTRKLAAYAHEAWSGWMIYMFNKSKLNEDGTMTIPADLVERWTRQSGTKYDDLPTEEQISDVDEAHKMIAIFDDWTA